MKYSNSWHLLRNDEVLRELSTDMYKGLSPAEVRRRRVKTGSNNIWRVKHRSAGDIATATLFDLATLLLVISAAAAALFDKNYEAGMIALILVLAGVMRAVTYVRANRIFEDLAREKIPAVTVIRGGVIKTVSASDIVVGDVIFLEAGDTVPCDGRVVSGEEATVSERGITGNRTPVHKFNTVIKTEAKSGEIPCEFRSNMLFAGSQVIKGSLRIVAVACGKNALVSMQKGGIEIIPAEQLPVIERMRGRSKATSLIMLACVMALTWLSLFISDGFTLPEVFLSTMAMAVAAMSEFITAIGYIIVAITLRDAADRKTDGVAESAAAHEETGSSKSASKIIIRDPAKLDEISMPDIVGFCGAQYFKSGKIEISSYRAGGVFVTSYGKDADGAHSSPLLSELLRLAAASTAEGVGDMVSFGAERDERRASLVGRAIEFYERASGDKLHMRYSLLEHIPASEARSGGIDCSLAAEGGKRYIIVSGAVDKVMRLCTNIIDKNGKETLSGELRRSVFTQCASLEFAGGHVIAVARKRTNETSLSPASITSGMTFSGFFSLSEEPEKETNSSIRANIDFIKRSGIVPVLFTENPDEDLYYCHRFKLFNKKTVKVRASDIKSVNIASLTGDGMIVSFADMGGVYLTAAYEDVVRVLRGEGENGERERAVAVVGMNVWDAGALTSADVGVAVSRSDYRSVPEALGRHSAVVVYPETDRTEAGFGGLTGFVRAVKYMRRVVENIDSAKIYITASQSARLILILASVFFRVPLMSAVFILVWGLLFDFVATLVMAFENNGRSDGYVRKRFIRTNEYLEKEAVGDGPLTAISAVIGVAWGMAIACLIPLIKALAPNLGIVYTDGIGRAVMAMAITMSGMVLSLETMRRGSIFIARSTSVAQILFVVMTVLLSLGFTMTSFGAGIAGGEACTECAIIAMIPAFFVLAASEIAKLVKRLKTKEKRPKRKSTRSDDAKKKKKAKKEKISKENNTEKGED